MCCQSEFFHLCSSPFMRTLSFRIYKSLLTHHIGEPTKSYKNLQVRHKKFKFISYNIH
ncbi:hypothetical protein BACI71_30860 [Bacillus mycoides]|uniref:Uncharacterized protein n=1 Tax=Bacillus mycoides TaxID=1405 RepID=A0A653YHS6_BACMY|nr:hypothetical protein BACI71_30860 [Bacillus mycoides]